RRLEVGGTILGAFPDARYQAETLRLNPGDTLVIFSDGVTDATSRDGVALGDDRLSAILDVEANADIDGTLRALFETVADFTRDAPQQDDLTAIVVRYLGDGSSVLPQPESRN